MNKIKDLHRLAKARYDELEKLTSTKRDNIKNWFTRNGLDVTKIKDFELYKQKILDWTMKKGRPSNVK